MISKSILTETKQLLGIMPEVENFDQDIVVAINGAFMTLNQLGVGPDITYAITDATETWEDFLNEDSDVQSVKGYIYLKVRMFFDPPGNSFLVAAMERQIDEYEWRLNAQAERVAKEGD